MDFGIKDYLFDASCIDDSSYIDEYYGWESIRNCAYQCAQHPEEISSLWYGLLRSMLYDWKADVKMDLNDAVSICFSSTRIERVFEPSLYYHESGCNDQFWYHDKSPIMAMSIYRTTVALFESINYWCWHDSHYLTFNEWGLRKCLKYPIHIEWRQYDEFLNGWEEKTE